VATVLSGHLGTQRPRLAPLEDESAFGELPGAVDLGEDVEIAEPGDHHPAGAILGVDVMGNGVAVTVPWSPSRITVFWPLKCIVAE
jgi:hypothetical protein